ncbi:DUF5131 family protein [Halorussus marinus]|uniref:DUF5131 family protein n=1 Tax=Halorussus marinus TaxID=2505976 RepID=UPI001093077D|nr:DUF5131 family protein [Halorussus marinus]
MSRDQPSAGPHHRPESLEQRTPSGKYPDTTHRIDQLSRVDDATRWVSFEPLIEPVWDVDLTGIDWALVGGEIASAADRCEMDQRESREMPPDPDVTVRACWRLPESGHEPEETLVTVRVVTRVRRIFNKGRLRSRQAKLGKNQRPEEPWLATLFFWTQRNKSFPLSQWQPCRSTERRVLVEYGGVITAAASA